ncbi:MAG: TIR domain-containing protein, partial [Gammaproteobacteria bacterium]|nr:TIR domain-containing protein [Gammaproteobacteria bacterium]
MSAEQEPAPSKASMPVGAVFLSYASEDAAAAERMAVTLRTAGIQVWFDREELRGGDTWDRQIRQQIHDCRLFIAMVSVHTEARDEGYFRREWRLAVERAGDMADGKAFVVPVVIDGTTERSAAVPDKFRELQWTRLPDGETPPAFVERVRRLLSSSARTAATPVSFTSAVLSPAGAAPPPWRSKTALWVTGALVAVTLAYIAVDRFLVSRHTSPPTPSAALPSQIVAAPPATAAAFNPPAHSVAVLPFVNMSGDKDQEYFSEGLTEELLNSLSRISELQVAARTSSFSFQGEHPDISTVAHKLNVGAVLEGSVRRSAHTVRVTAQLINGVTGFHLWSQTYDRDLGDVLKLQTEIATTVASALKVSLLGDAAARIEMGGTSNPAAFDAYLRGWRSFYAASKPDDYRRAIDLHSQAIQIDPNYALAFAARSDALANYAGSLVEYANPKTVSSLLSARDSALDRALEDAQKAIALAPTMGEAYAALGLASATALEFGRAGAAMERAITLAPGNARVLRLYGFVTAPLGRVNTSIVTGRQALLLDPLNAESAYNLSGALFYGRRYAEALAVLQKAGTDP